MTTVLVGDPTQIIYVHDNATIGNALYIWYFNGTVNKLHALQLMNNPLAADDVHFTFPMFDRNQHYRLTTQIKAEGGRTMEQNYQNMLKAYRTWMSSVGHVLYLYARPEGATGNFALTSEKATPATLIQMKGRLGNLKERWDSASIFVQVDFIEHTAEGEG